MTDTIHIVLAMKPIEGNFVQNALEHEVAGLNIDGCRVEGASGDGHWTHKREIGDGNISAGGGRQEKDFGSENPNGGRFPANVIHDGSEEVGDGFPDSKGMSGGGTRRQKSEIMPSIQVRESSEHSHLYRGDSGSAARFFKECKLDGDELDDDA
tara:strand:- start:1113 stop:1574 length:462 start_codon:yes stop_codon:yes gene_type:complete